MNAIPADLAPVDIPFADDHLDEYLRTGPIEIPEPEEGEEEPVLSVAPELVAVQRWSITDDGAAEWAMRMLQAIEDELEALARQKREWVAPIDRWYGDAVRRVEPRAEFFRAHLQMYAIRRRAERPQEATLRLPSGSVATVKPNTDPKAVLADEAAFIKWAGDTLPEDQYSAVVKETAKALVSEIRKLVEIKDTTPEPEEGAEPTGDTDPVYVVVWKSTGEIVAGLEVEVPEGIPTATVHAG